MISARSYTSPALLALSKRDYAMAIIDPADLYVIARVSAGDNPHEVTASADGKTAYLSNYGFGAGLRYHQ